MIQFDARVGPTAAEGWVARVGDAVLQLEILHSLLCDGSEESSAGNICCKETLELEALLQGLNLVNWIRLSEFQINTECMHGLYHVAIEFEVDEIPRVPISLNEKVLINHALTSETE